jgi:hypothetical protein
MKKEQGAEQHEQGLPSVPATPPLKSSGSLNGASSSGTTTDKTTSRLDDLEQNEQMLINVIK